MITNYYKLKDRRLLHYKYVFVDTKDQFHIRLSYRYGIRLCKAREMIKEGTDIRLVMCDIKKGDEAIFLEMLGEVRNSALLCGYRDYDECCELLQSIVNVA